MWKALARGGLAAAGRSPVACLSCVAPLGTTRLGQTACCPDWSPCSWSFAKIWAAAELDSRSAVSTDTPWAWLNETRRLTPSDCDNDPASPWRRGHRAAANWRGISPVSLVPLLCPSTCTISWPYGCCEVHDPVRRRKSHCARLRPQCNFVLRTRTADLMPRVL